MTMYNRSVWIPLALAGLGLAWLGVNLQQARQQQAAVARILQWGGSVVYRQPITGVQIEATEVPQPNWFERVLGNDFFLSAHSVSLPACKIGDDDLAWLAPLPKLRFLLLSYTPIGDAGLPHLERLRNLDSLLLRSTSVTDAGLVRLKVLRKLKLLDLGGTQVSDAGLAHLEGLANLEQLCLDGTHVTDAGLPHLKGLTKLESLDLRSTRITEQGAAELRRALPNLTVDGP